MQTCFTKSTFFLFLGPDHGLQSARQSVLEVAVRVTDLVPDLRSDPVQGPVLEIVMRFLNPGLHLDLRSDSVQGPVLEIVMRFLNSGIHLDLQNSFVQNSIPISSRSP
jgi:hypothetical protein